MARQCGRMSAAAEIARRNLDQGKKTRPHGMVERVAHTRRAIEDALQKRICELSPALNVHADLRVINDQSPRYYSLLRRGTLNIKTQAEA